MRYITATEMHQHVSDKEVKISGGEVGCGWLLQEIACLVIYSIRINFRINIFHFRKSEKNSDEDASTEIL